jgi:hypothetical protein
MRGPGAAGTAGRGPVVVPCCRPSALCYTPEVFSPGSHKLFLASLAFVGAVSGVLTATALRAASEPKDAYENLETFAGIMAIVQRHYVDEVGTKDLVEGAIRGMIASLDPHSA